MSGKYLCIYYWLRGFTLWFVECCYRSGSDIRWNVEMAVSDVTEEWPKFKYQNREMGDHSHSHPAKISPTMRYPGNRGRRFIHGCAVRNALRKYYGPYKIYCCLIKCMAKFHFVRVACELSYAGNKRRCCCDFGLVPNFHKENDTE